MRAFFRPILFLLCDNRLTNITLNGRCRVTLIVMPGTIAMAAALLARTCVHFRTRRRKGLMSAFHPLRTLDRRQDYQFRRFQTATQASEAPRRRLDWHHA